MPVNVSLEWPAELGCPLRQGYRVAPNLRFDTLEMEDGPPRYRLINTEETRVISMTFLFTAQQLDVFERFYHVDLDAGSQWFIMKQLTGLGMVDMVCHFIGDRVVRAARDLFGRFEVTFDLDAFATDYEIPPPFVMSDPVDGGTALEPPYQSVYDARTASDATPTDRINALSPAVGA